MTNSKEYSRAYYQRNKDKLLKYSREYESLATTKIRQKEYRAKNKDRYRENIKLWKIKNPERVKKMRDRWKKEHPEYHKNYDKIYKKKYPEKVARHKIKSKEKREVGQADRPKPKCCDVCGLETVICFDHDHKTMRFRGWLCRRCNTILGFARDNSVLLASLSVYLKEKL